MENIVKYYFLKYLSFVGIFALASISYAEEHSLNEGHEKSNAVEQVQCEPMCQPCCPSMYEPQTAMYNEADKIQLQCDWNMYASVSFLYWYAREKGLELGWLRTPTTTITDFDMIHMDFKYKPGFKVALGTRTNYDNWGLSLEYTRMHGSFSKGKSVPQPTASTDPTIQSAWFVTLFKVPNPGINDNMFSTSNTWKLDLDMLDLELARAYWMGQKVTLMPYAGLKAGWLDQKYNVTAITVDTLPAGDVYTLYANDKSDSWLIGPRIGLDSKWLLGCGFSIVGDVAANLFYQKFKVKIQNNTDYPSTGGSVLVHNNRVSFVNPSVELNLGFGWDKDFYCDKMRFELLASYEMQCFWNQNMIRNTQDNYNISAFVALPDADAGSLVLHGLTITAGLHF